MFRKLEKVQNDKKLIVETRFCQGLLVVDVFEAIGHVTKNCALIG